MLASCVAPALKIFVRDLPEVVIRSAVMQGSLIDLTATSAVIKECGSVPFLAANISHIRNFFRFGRGYQGYEEQTIPYITNLAPFEH